MKRSNPRHPARIRRRARLAAAGVVWLGVFLASAGATGEPDFGRWYPYEQALELGRAYERPVLLYFRSDHCPYCEQMETFVLSAPAVDRTLRECLVVASITLGRAGTAEVAQRWRVFGTPTFVFTRPRGEAWVEVSRAFGSMPRAEFLAFLNAVCKEEGP
jgi:thioredoxin-related protein